MEKKIIYFVVLLLIFYSCDSSRSESREGIYFNDEDVIASYVKSTKIPNVCDSIKIAGTIMYQSGRVIVNEFGPNALFHVIDIEHKAHVGQFGNKGRGPGEMSMPWTIIKTNDENFQMFDPQQKKVVLYSLDSLEKIKPYVKQYQFEKLYGASDIIVLDEKVYYLSSLKIENRIYISDVEGKDLNGLGEFPVVNSDFPDNTFAQGYQAKVNFYENTFVLGYKTTPLIQIFNSQTDEWKLIIGPEQFPSIFKKHPNPQMAMGFTDETRTGYVDIRISENFIYALYSGKKIFGPEDPTKSDIIYKFDLNGNPLQKIILDEGVFSFDVADDRFIYGITINLNGNYELLEFDLNL